MTYKLTFLDKFKVSGRHPVNFGGVIVLFEDGIGYTDSEVVADQARRVRFIASVQREGEIEEPQTKTTTPEVFADAAPGLIVEESRETGEEPASSEELVVELASSEELVVAPPSDVEGLEQQESSGVADAPQEEIDLNALHRELKTWSAVAAYLDITMAQLRKLREGRGI